MGNMTFQNAEQGPSGIKGHICLSFNGGDCCCGSGRVPLATPEVPGIVMPRHGLTIDEQGALDVDFSQLPADRFKELLQSLHVPMPLSADMDFFIRQDGSDSNTGLTDSPEGAWRTIQHAVNYVSENYDLRSFRAIVHLGAGSWSERSLCVPAMKASTGKLTILGCGVSSSILLTQNYDLYFSFGADIIFDNVHFVCSGGGGDGRLLVQNSHVHLKKCLFTGDITSGNPLTCSAGGYISIAEGCEVSVNASSAMAVADGRIVIKGDMNISGTYTRSVVFAMASGKILRYSGTLPVITGSATGVRYSCNSNAFIDSQGGGPNYFPGTSPGVTSTGGQYR